MAFKAYLSQSPATKKPIPLTKVVVSYAFLTEDDGSRLALLVHNAFFMKEFLEGTMPSVAGDQCCAVGRLYFDNDDKTMAALGAAGASLRPYFLQPDHFLAGRVTGNSKNPIWLFSCIDDSSHHQNTLEDINMLENLLKNMEGLKIPGNNKAFTIVNRGDIILNQSDFRAFQILNQLVSPRDNIVHYHSRKSTVQECKQDAGKLCYLYQKIIYVYV